MISFRTDIKEKSNSKTGKVKTLVIINLCLALLCAATFGTSAFVVKANAASYETEKKISNDWYEIEDNGNTLTVHLDRNIPGYKWKYGLSNNNLRELHYLEIPMEKQMDDKKYDWSAHFASSSDKNGNVTITFQYVHDRDSKPIDTRTISLYVENGIITQF